MGWSKLDRSFWLGVGAAPLIFLGAGVGAICPTGLDPYSDESNPFGWPVTPAAFRHEHPECWASKYEHCAGSRQSPMDLNLLVRGEDCEVHKVGSDGNLAGRGSYTILAGRPLLEASTYLRGILMKGDIGKLILEDSEGRPVEYTASDAVLTTPGLHSVNGQLADAELLIIHERKGAVDAFDARVIVSVTFAKSDTGSSDLFDQMGFAGGPLPEIQPWRAPKSIDLRSLMQEALSGRSLSYAGSVPVPPCTENVHYIVLAKTQPVSELQLSGLEDVMSKFAGGTHKRLPVPRLGPNGICRHVDENSAKVPAAELGCTAPSNGTALCWTSTCGKSPIGIDARGVDRSEAPFDAAEAMLYHPAEHVVVSPSRYTLDASGHFGTLLLNGRHFDAVKLSLKAVSQHSFGGKRHAAELVIEHVLFGDRLVDSEHGAAPADHGGSAEAGAHGGAASDHGGGAQAGDTHVEEAPGGEAHAEEEHGAGTDDAHAASHGATDEVAAGGHHRRLDSHAAAPTDAAAAVGHTTATRSKVEHRVMVSVPLKVGRESALLRSLGLGIEAHQEAIRHGGAYTLVNSVDLASVLRPSVSGPWYFYSGGPTAPGPCPAWGVRWMVFEQPLEISFKQLNDLALQVSGIDSTLRPAPIDMASVRAGFVPVGGVEDGQCDADHHYQTTACWGEESPIFGSGGSQSPINIEASEVGEVGRVNFLSKASWKPLVGLSVENDGYGLGFRTNQMGYTAVVGPDGFPKYYQVDAVTLRMPSEHMIDGKQYAAELQVVQKNQKTVLSLDEGDAIVSSFFFELGEESKLLKQLLPEHLPGVGESAPIEQPVDLQWGLGPVLDGAYYAYQGSYTTPGCQEAVRWVVFKTPLTLSKQQWKAFRDAYPHGNNRPVQPLNGRPILESSLGEPEPVDYRYFLNRHGGRDKKDTAVGYIIFPVLGTLSLCSVIMVALFQREDPYRKSCSAGGMVCQAPTIGKGYDKL